MEALALVVTKEDKSLVSLLLQFPLSKIDIPTSVNGQLGLKSKVVIGVQIWEKKWQYRAEPLGHLSVQYKR